MIAAVVLAAQVLAMPVYSQADITIPSGQTVDVVVSLPSPEEGDAWVVLPESPKGLHVEATIVLAGEVAQVSVRNTSARPVRIPPNTRLGRAILVTPKPVEQDCSIPGLCEPTLATR